MTVDYKINHNTRIITSATISDIKKEFNSISDDPQVMNTLMEEIQNHHIKLENVDTRIANLIKRSIEKLGGFCFISGEAAAYTVRTTDMILSSSKKKLLFLSKRLRSSQCAMSDISREIEVALENRSGILKIKNTVFDLNQNPILTGFINCSKGVPGSLNKFIKRIEHYIKNGASIIELDFSNMVSLDCYERNSNLISFLSDIKKIFPCTLFSVSGINYILNQVLLDTGIEIVNCCVSNSFNKESFKCFAKSDTVVIFSTLHSRDRLCQSNSAALREFQSNISLFKTYNIEKERIIIKPGIKFKKNEKENYLATKELASLKRLKLPVMADISLNSFLNFNAKKETVANKMSQIMNEAFSIINTANIIRLRSPEHVKLLTNIITSIKNCKN